MNAQATPPPIMEPLAIYSAVAHDEFEGEKILNRKFEDLTNGILRVLNSGEMKFRDTKSMSEAWEFRLALLNWLFTKSPEIQAQRHIMVSQPYVLKGKKSDPLYRAVSNSINVQNAIRIPIAKPPPKITIEQVITSYDKLPIPPGYKILYRGLFETSLDLTFFTITGLLVLEGDIELGRLSVYQDLVHMIKKTTEFYGAHLIALKLWEAPDSSQQSMNMTISAGGFQAKAGLTKKLDLSKIA